MILQLLDIGAVRNGYNLFFAKKTNIGTAINKPLTIGL